MTIFPKHFTLFISQGICLDKTKQNLGIRSSRPEVLCNITKKTLAQAFSCEFCELSKNTYSYKTPSSGCFSGVLWFVSQKMRITISANLFLIAILLHIIALPWDIDHKLKTRVFHFKLIHPCSWIHIILASHYLPVQTHHNF